MHQSFHLESHQFRKEDIPEQEKLAWEIWEKLAALVLLKLFIGKLCQTSSENCREYDPWLSWVLLYTLSSLGIVQHLGYLGSWQTAFFGPGSSTGGRTVLFCVCGRTLALGQSLT